MANRAIVLMAGLLLGLPIVPATAGEDRAHVLAQEFAGGAETAKRNSKADEAKRRAAEKAREAARVAAEARRRADEARQTAVRLKADEADMLDRARAEATERRAEQLRAEAEIERAEQDQAEAERHAAQAAAEAARKRSESPSRDGPDLGSEAEQRQRAQKLKAEAARIAADKARHREAERRAEVERRIKTEETRAAEAERLYGEAERHRGDQEREAEEAVAAAARARDEFRRQGGTDADDDTAADRSGDGSRHGDVTDEDNREEFDEADYGTEYADVAAGSKTHVTVLLVMDAGHRGIRRWQRGKADPMLCIGDKCYISTGPDTPATELPRRKAFGPGVALGIRAGACRNSLTCVFRGVDLGAESAWLQPIDLRILRHDRRQTSPASLDRTCAVHRGHLSCTRTVVANDYRAWIVPERVAARAGPDALERALETGLDEHRRAAFEE